MRSKKDFCILKRGVCIMNLNEQLTSLKKRVETAILQFSQGHGILIGDDGKRENEVDFVFHGSFATPEIVNLAITHAKGLLCVALDHDIADKLGFYTAPRFPGGISHTNFTLTVDARHGITSGISAKDRAYTIQLMGKQEASASDFLTPGHVFPCRAMDGGLLSRAGHTEALYELCKLSKLPCVGAMCEVLGENGEPISPATMKSNHPLSKHPYLSTVDLLWYKIFFTKNTESVFQASGNDNKYLYSPKSEEFLTLPCAVQFYSHKCTPENIRIVLHDGFTTKDNGVEKNKCCVEIVFMEFEDIDKNIPEYIEEFCDLSARIGLKNTKTSVKRLVSMSRALSFIAQKTDLPLRKEEIERITFPLQSDKEFLLALI